MKKATGILYWAPRILSILFICFLTLFSFDVFELGLSPGETALAFFMHSIPSIVLLVLLLIAWKFELVGAFAFIGAGLLYMGLTALNAFRSGFQWYMALATSMTLAGPAFLIGVLFLMSFIMKKRNSVKTEKND